jgi:hypothetical protein
MISKLCSTLFVLETITVPSRIDAAFQRPEILNHQARKVERVVPNALTLGPLSSAWGQANPPLDCSAFLISDSFIAPTARSLPCQTAA